MCIVIIYFPLYDVINFEVNLSFFIKPFFYMAKKSQYRNLNIFRKETAFKIK